MRASTSGKKSSNQESGLFLQRVYEAREFIENFDISNALWGWNGDALPFIRLKDAQGNYIEAFLISDEEDSIINCKFGTREFRIDYFTTGTSENVDEYISERDDLFQLLQSKVVAHLGQVLSDLILFDLKPQQTLVQGVLPFEQEITAELLGDPNRQLPAHLLSQNYVEGLKSFVREGIWWKESRTTFKGKVGMFLLEVEREHAARGGIGLEFVTYTARLFFGNFWEEVSGEAIETLFYCLQKEYLEENISNTPPKDARLTFGFDNDSDGDDGVTT